MDIIDNPVPPSYDSTQFIHTCPYCNRGDVKRDVSHSWFCDEDSCKWCMFYSPAPMETLRKMRDEFYNRKTNFNL